MTINEAIFRKYTQEHPLDESEIKRLIEGGWRIKYTFFPHPPGEDYSACFPTIHLITIDTNTTEEEQFISHIEETLHALVNYYNGLTGDQEHDTIKALTEYYHQKGKGPLIKRIFDQEGAVVIIEEIKIKVRGSTGKDWMISTSNLGKRDLKGTLEWEIKPTE